MKEFVGAAAYEAVPGASIDQPDRDDAVVDILDVGVLAEQDPGVAPGGLDSVKDSGPQPPNVDEAELTGGRPGSAAGAGGCRLRGDCCGFGLATLCSHGSRRLANGGFGLAR